MKTLTYTTALFMAMAATSVFAHHPSDGTNPNFDMVTDQLEVVESPHLDMVMDDMGATTAAGDAAMDQATSEQAGWASEQTQDGTMTLDQPQEAMGSAAAADTMNLLEEVAPQP